MEGLRLGDLDGRVVKPIREFTAFSSRRLHKPDSVAGFPSARSTVSFPSALAHRGGSSVFFAYSAVLAASAEVFVLLFATRPSNFELTFDMTTSIFRFAFGRKLPDFRFALRLVYPCAPFARAIIANRIAFRYSEVDRFANGAVLPLYVRYSHIDFALSVRTTSPWWLQFRVHVHRKLIFRGLIVHRHF